MSIAFARAPGPGRPLEAMMACREMLMLSPVRSVVTDILYAQVMEFLLRLVEWKRLSRAELRMMQ
jgi:hypothetical protein